MRQPVIRVHRLRIAWPLVMACLLAICGPPAAAQPGNQQQRIGADGLSRGNSLIGAGNRATGFGPGAASRGGAEDADFDSLIDLIQSTVAVESWAEAGGGEAEIRPFPGGVLVDTHEALSRLTQEAPAAKAEFRRQPPPQQPLVRADPRRRTDLRYVSLPRLEREIARRQAEHESLDVAMLALAGLQRVEYVLLYPESGDLVLAGPASDWQVDDRGRILSVDGGQPVVRLDDLLVLLRRWRTSPSSPFGCSITPRQKALAATQDFLDRSSRQPIQPRLRERWLAQLRDSMGMQTVEVWGIDPASRVAGVIVEADYHMKLVGMGLEESVAGVESYLDMIHVAPGEAPPPLSVLRWWFTMHYQAIQTAADGNAYAIVGQGVRVLSENELLGKQGERIHTGESELLNRQFAQSFTKHFDLLCQKYPLYADLRNVFDLALVVGLIESRDLASRVGWEPTLLTDGQRLRLPQWVVPRQVETVINHRVINRRHIVAGVSGGVLVAADEVLKHPSGEAENRRLANMREAVPGNLPASVWWWDHRETDEP